MPLEGHWERQNTPLRRTTVRENRVVAMVAIFTVVLIAVVLVFALTTGSAKLGAGCIRITAAGNTGGYVLHPCGADAVAFCHQEAPRTDAFAREARARCRGARIPAA